MSRDYSSLRLGLGIGADGLEKDVGLLRGQEWWPIIAFICRDSKLVQS